MSCELRNDKPARGKRAGKTLDPRERIWSTRKLELSPPEKKRVEEWRTRREFTGWNNWGKTEEAPHKWNWCLKQTQAPRRKRVGGRENKGNLEGETDEYPEEKTPVEIIEKREQRLCTSRMDTRLRTPVLRRKRVGGWEKKTNEDGETTSLRANWGLNLAKKKRLESTRREMHRMERAENQRTKN